MGESKTLEAKLNRYIREGKPRFVTIDQQKIYLSKEKIKQFQNSQEKHEGGLIPLLGLLPAILGGIGIAAGVGTMGAKIAQTVNASKHNKTMEDIEKQKLAEIKKAGQVLRHASGEGILLDAASKLEQVPSEAVKWLLRTFKVKKEKEGNGIILRPYEG